MRVPAREYEGLAHLLVAQPVPLLIFSIFQEREPAKIARRNQIAWHELSNTQSSAITEDERVILDRMANGLPETLSV